MDLLLVGVVQIAGQTDVREAIGESLLHLPFSKKSHFLWFAGMCALLWDVYGGRNNKVFRGLEKDHSEVWSLVRFHVSL